MRFSHCQRYPATARWYPGKCWCGHWQPCIALTRRPAAVTWPRFRRAPLRPGSYRFSKRFMAARSPVHRSLRRPMHCLLGFRAAPTFLNRRHRNWMRLLNWATRTAILCARSAKPLRSAAGRRPLISKSSEQYVFIRALIEEINTKTVNAAMGAARTRMPRSIAHAGPKSRIGRPAGRGLCLLAFLCAEGGRGGLVPGRGSGGGSRLSAYRKGTRGFGSLGGRWIQEGYQGNGSCQCAHRHGGAIRACQRHRPPSRCIHSMAE